MNTSSKNSAASSASETKSDFDDDRDSTLPEPSEVKVQNTLSEGSVMWAVPSQQGEGTAPAHQGTSTSFEAGGVTNSPTAVREVNLDALPATPDAQHKTVETTHAQPSVSSSINSVPVTQFAKDTEFVSETNSITKPVDRQKVYQLLFRLHQFLKDANVGFTADPPKAPLRLVSLAEPEPAHPDKAVMEQAKVFLEQLDKQRRLRKDTAASARTIEGYLKDCVHLDRVRDQLLEETGYQWFEVLSMYAPVERTFYAYRAALTWRAKEYLKGLLGAFDAQKNNVGLDAALALLPEIEKTLHELQSIRALTQENCLAWSGQDEKESYSKRNDLRYLDAQWRDRFIHYCERSPTYKHASVLLRYCGMRPEELEKGVQVQLRDRRIEVRIEGGKVRNTAGQPWRVIKLHVPRLPVWFVEDVALGKVKAVKVNKDSFRAYLNGLTDRVLRGAVNAKKRKVMLSAYLFRHEIATDLRDNDWTSTEIAALLGEVVAETAAHYGMPRRSRGKLKPKLSVIRGSMQTARPVRSRKTKASQQPSASAAKSLGQ